MKTPTSPRLATNRTTLPDGDVKSETLFVHERSHFFVIRINSGSTSLPDLLTAFGSLH